MSEVLKQLEAASKTQNDSFYDIHKTGDETLITLHAETTCRIMDAEKAERDRLRKEWNKKHPIKAFYNNKIWPKYTSYWHSGGWHWCFHTKINLKEEGYKNCNSFTCTCGSTINNFNNVRTIFWQDKIQSLLFKYLG